MEAATPEPRKDTYVLASLGAVAAEIPVVLSTTVQGEPFGIVYLGESQVMPHTSAEAFRIGRAFFELGSKLATIEAAGDAVEVANRIAADVASGCDETCPDTDAHRALVALAEPLPPGHGPNHIDNAGKVLGCDGQCHPGTCITCGATVSSDGTVTPASLVGQRVERVDDDSNVPVVGEIVRRVDDEWVMVSWDGTDDWDRTALDELRPAGTR